MSKKMIVSKRDIDEAKDALRVTKGCTGSQTIACRLWHDLNRLVKATKPMGEKRPANQKESAAR